MRFDNEQLSQLKQVMQETFHEEVGTQQFKQVIREVIHEEVPGIVTKIVAEAEERIVRRITNSVAEMIEDNILPQFQELRDDLAATKVELKQDVAGLKHDVAVIQRDMTEMKYDIGSLKRDVTGFRVGSVQLTA